MKSDGAQPDGAGISAVTGGTRQIGRPGDVDTPIGPASASMTEPMNEACDETTSRHPADNFEPLAPTLEQLFENEEEKFVELSEEVQERIARAMGFSVPAALSPEEVQELIKRGQELKIPIDTLPEYIRERNARARALSMAAPHWDVRSPGQRRCRAQHRDIESHPGLAVEREALEKKGREIADCERTASNIPLENRPMNDVQSQKEELRKLRKEEAALEEALQQRARSLGLGWPYAPAALAPVRPGHVDPEDGLEAVTETNGQCGFSRGDFTDPNSAPQKIAAWARTRFADGIPDRPRMLEEHRTAFGRIPGLAGAAIREARTELQDVIKTGAPAHKKNRRADAAPQ